jgi:hypothetical protein
LQLSLGTNLGRTFVKKEQKDLWENDPYTVPTDEKNLALHREKDKAKFGKLIPGNRRKAQSPDPRVSCPPSRTPAADATNLRGGEGPSIGIDVDLA